MPHQQHHREMGWQRGQALFQTQTVFPGFTTPRRCLYITRTGLWLPVFKYYCPSGPRHVCHLKQIIACSSSLLCFKTCKKASALPAELEMKMYDSSPNSQSGATAAGSNGLLPPWKLESQGLIFPNPLLTCYVQSTLPHSPALCFSSCLWSIFFWFALEAGSAEKSRGAPSHQDHLFSGLWLFLPVSVQQQEHHAEGVALWSKFNQLSQTVM